MKCCLLFGLLLSLIGCGPQTTGNSGPAPLRVGMELSTPPFEMADPNGKPDGVSVRLAEAMAAKLQRPLQIEILAFKGLETALKTGKIDVILSSMTDTPKRRESIAFSEPYCHIGLALLVPKASAVQTVADLNQAGKKVIVRLGTTAVDYVKATLPQAEIVMLDQNAACLLEITQQKADAFIYDQLSIQKLQASQPDTTRAILAPLQREAWAMALRKDDAALKAKIDAFLAEYRQQGGFTQLAERYLAAEKAALAAQGVPFIFE
jgi:polar amino acid transport system substrate-binding protein